jgi:hypothetical protein
MVEIVVELPSDRRFVGTLTLKDDHGKALAGPFQALGKSDGLALRRARRGKFWNWHQSQPELCDLPLGGACRSSYR